MRQLAKSLCVKWPSVNARAGQILCVPTHKLKMPIMLGMLSLCVLADKIYTSLLIHKIGGLGIIISIILFTTIIQSFRSSKYLEKTEHKILKGIASVIFIIVVLLTLIVLIKPNIFEDTEWSNEKTLLFKDAISKSYLDLANNPKLQNVNELYIKGIAEKTAECSINEIKIKFPNYAIFINGLGGKGDNEVKRELNKIKNNCFTQSLQK